MIQNFYGYLLQTIIWVCWCSLHSLLISRTVTRFWQRRLGKNYRRYRLTYNVVSTVTLFIPVGYSFHLQRYESALLSWTEHWSLLRITMIGTALFLFWAGARQYDMSHFLGITQLRSDPGSVAQNEQNSFSTAGISSVIRHPWYLGGILLVWSAPSPFYPSTVITAFILTAYFFIGTLLEERKLHSQYGEAYERYQQQVSMLFPHKWVYRCLADKKESRQARSNSADEND